MRSGHHPRPRPPPAAAGQVRIIGGRWRGRRLQFPAVDGLRPTGDRLRETLFSWLLPQLLGARCLDLFAGSGALGLEAASRGAAAVVLVESSATVVQALRANCTLLGAANVEIVQADARAWLEQRSDTTFDVVFLDPPFQSGLVSTAANDLETGAWLAPGAWIYIESAVDQAWAALPANWRLHRAKSAGRVNCRLYQRN